MSVSTYEPVYVVSGLAQSAHDGGTYQPTGSGNENPHAPTLANERSWHKGPGRSERALPWESALSELMSESELVGEIALLETLLDRGEEPTGISTVDQAVIVGQWQVCHRPYGDAVVTVGVAGDDGPLHHRAGTQNARLRLHDDRRVEQRTVAADVGDRERAATELVRLDVVVACTLREIRDAVCQSCDAEFTRVVDHHGQQTTVGVHGDTQMYRAVVGDLLGFLVVGGVDVRVLLERLHRRLREEGEERQGDALTFPEGLLGALPQFGDPRHVDLVHLGQLCGGL